MRKMLVDFGLVLRKEKSLPQLAQEFDAKRLGEALDGYVAVALELILQLSDAEIAFLPRDPEADDPFATSEDERHMPWSIAHQVAHVTATAEEAAAFSSLLARGICIGGRLRSEHDWHSMTTAGEAVARLEECRRICRGYLLTWPNHPDLATYRSMPEPYAWMKPNAPVSFLWGLMHWHKHIAQFERVAAEARATLRMELGAAGGA